MAGGLACLVVLNAALGNGSWTWAGRLAALAVGCLVAFGALDSLARSRQEKRSQTHSLRPTKTSVACPACGTMLTPTEQVNLLRCLNKNCEIGYFDPVENQGLLKMPSLPTGVRSVSKGEGLTEMSKTIPADAPLPEGWREGR
jgi:hypothetical protein